MYDNKIVAAASTECADGTFLVRVEIEAQKWRVDSAGVEREVAMDDWVDIAIFDDARPSTYGTPIVAGRKRLRAPRAMYEFEARSPTCAHSS
jgi:hypothetical protein